MEAGEGLKARMLKLLREDEEFRYAVAGLVGLAEIIKRLDRHDEKFVEVLKRLDKHDEKFVEVMERLDKHDEKFVEVLKRLDKHDEKFVEVLERLDMHSVELNKHSMELVKLREDMNQGFKRFNEELARLREDMGRGFELVNRHISALGARWGLMAEEAFREGLRGILERELGFKVERWRAYDEHGRVFGYPSEVEVDITIKDEKLILIEVSSHMRASDILQFKRKAQLYQEKTGRKPDRLLAVTPYADGKALKAAESMGIEVYTKI